jgi:signal transduction histidine kinase
LLQSITRIDQPSEGLPDGGTDTADRISVTEELRLPGLHDLCEAVIVASPAGQVLFHTQAGTSGGVWPQLLAAGDSGSLSPALSKLVRTQWLRRPEADAIFIKLGSHVVLARAQAQPAEQPQVVVTLVDVTTAMESVELPLPESELAAERRRLARELHDQVGQRLATLIVNLDCDLRERKADLNLTRIYRDELRAILVSVRSTHQDLRWTPAAAGGLIGAIRRQVVPALVRAGCGVRLTSRRWPGRVPPSDALHILRMVQESAANVIRHAQATRTVIRMDGNDDSALVSITDNGVGFQSDESRRIASGSGLSGMRERASLIGGDLRVVSAPGLGTTISLVVPLHE